MQTQRKILPCFSIAFMLILVITNSPVQAQADSPVTDPVYLSLSPRTASVNFKWLGDSLQSAWEPHTAILLPVKLKNCPARLYMQFDLGSPYSLLYKNKLKALLEKYPSSVKPGDERIENFSFKTGSISVTAKEIAVKQFDSSGIDWSDSKSVVIIGTIGADFIDGKTVMINYPEMRLTISSSAPSKLQSRLVMNEFVYVGRRVLIPAKIGAKQTLLYFDTGSSMYELLTSKQTCESLAIPGAAMQQNKVGSWDKIITTSTLPTNATIHIGGNDIPIRNVTYVEGISNSQTEQMMKMGIGGMTGNKLFMDYTLVLDTKNKKFGLIQKR